MVYGSRDGASSVVPGGSGGVPGRAAPARPGEPGLVPPVVRRSRDRPPGPLPGVPDAGRGDRAILHRAGRRAGCHGHGHPRALGRPTRRDVRVLAARRRQRLGAVPHHHRREGRLGPGLRHRGDPADARPRVRDPRAASGRAVRVRVQRAGHPGLSTLRLRAGGPLARVDLPRRPVVGRAGHERARVRLAPAQGRGGVDRGGARPVAGRGGRGRGRSRPPCAGGCVATRRPNVLQRTIRRFT